MDFFRSWRRIFFRVGCPITDFGAPMSKKNHGVLGEDFELEGFTCEHSYVLVALGRIVARLTSYCSSFMFALN